ncbi:MAG: DUF5317 family protein [bacterium]|nr:DUF5317 family protein [bacterium]
MIQQWGFLLPSLFILFALVFLKSQKAVASINWRSFVYATAAFVIFYLAEISELSNNLPVIEAITFGTIALLCLIDNYKEIGIAIYALGQFSNMLVVVLNGGRMPSIDLPAETLRHTPMTNETILPFLSDWIYFQRLDILFSIGDVLLGLGIIVFSVKFLFFSKE